MHAMISKTKLKKNNNFSSRGLDIIFASIGNWDSDEVDFDQYIETVTIGADETYNQTADLCYVINRTCEGQNPLFR